MRKRQRKREQYWKRFCSDKRWWNKILARREEKQTRLKCFRLSKTKIAAIHEMCQYSNIGEKSSLGLKKTRQQDRPRFDKILVRRTWFWTSQWNRDIAHRDGQDVMVWFISWFFLFLTIVNKYLKRKSLINHFDHSKDLSISR